MVVVEKEDYVYVAGSEVGWVYRLVDSRFGGSLKSSVRLFCSGFGIFGGKICTIKENG